jgi:hypothetical protein
LFGNGIIVTASEKLLTSASEPVLIRPRLGVPPRWFFKVILFRKRKVSVLFA